MVVTVGADIITGTPAFDPAGYPAASVIGVPWVTEDSFAAARAFDVTVRESELMQAEFAANNLHVLVTLPTATVVLGSNEPVEDTGWFEGRSIRGGGLTLQALEAVGANPVAIPIGELYESMDRHCRGLVLHQLRQRSNGLQPRRGHNTHH